MPDVASLAGLIPPEVGVTLARYAEQVPAEQAIVELGSFKGKSACYMATTARAHIYAVDPWDSRGNVTGRFGYANPNTRLVFEAQVKRMGFQERITPVKAFAVDAAAGWDGPRVGLLFVDSDHSEVNVLKDTRAWIPHLAAEAMVILDDYGTPKNPGVRKAADKLVAELGPYRLEAGRLAVYTP